MSYPVAHQGGAWPRAQKDGEMLGGNPRGAGHVGNDWDAALVRSGGDLLQSWRWGVFKQRHGWKVSRIRVEGPDGDAMAQVLFRPQGPMSIAYLPRGPIVPADAEITAALLHEVDAACAKHRAIVLVVEPDRPLPSAWLESGGGFAPGPDPFQTSQTVKVHLAPDTVLLNQMRKDTRANVLHARRRGVVVERAPIDAAAIGTFFGLLQETSKRNEFGIHSRRYYEDFLRIFDDQAVLLFSHLDGEVTAGLIAARCGSEGRSMYAGSSTTHRGRGDTALIRLEAMRWAREHGCSRYDLGGIASGAPPAGTDRDPSVRSQTGSSLDGVHQFKTGFGGEIVAYPATVERRYRPALAWLARRVSSRYRATPNDHPTGRALSGLSFPLS